jgi:hypothetical protein
MTTLMISLIGVLLLMAVHLFGYRMDSLLSRIPRGYWLSFASGVSISYVFLHIMPELHEGEEVAAGAVADLFGVQELLIYIVALAGAVLFYGLRRLTAHSDQIDRSRQEILDFAFWLSIGAFAIYNAIVAHTIHHRAEIGADVLAAFVVAMSLHFTVNDYGLHRRFFRAYERYGRWTLVVAIAVGWSAGFMVNASEAAILIMLAFLMGGTVLHVLAEELPEQRTSSYGAFLAGAIVYSFVLVGL